MELYLHSPMAQRDVQICMDPGLARGSGSGFISQILFGFVSVQTIARKRKQSFFRNCFHKEGVSYDSRTTATTATKVFTPFC
jgi:hypothetical protein